MGDPAENNPLGAGGEETGGLTSGQLIGIIVGVVVLLLCIIFKVRAPGGRNKYRPDLSGKVIIVTGANTGIGFSAALEMAKLGP